MSEQVEQVDSKVEVISNGDDAKAAENAGDAEAKKTKKPKPNNKSECN